MEIIVFSYGEARDANTWSNVPSFAVNALEQMGHIVHCVNFGPRSSIENNIVIWGNRFIKLFLGRDTLFNIEQWPYWQKYHARLIDQAIKKYPKTQLLMFFSYSITSGRKYAIPSLMFCDFTIDYTIREVQKRAVRRSETKLVQRQDRLVESTNYIVSLFPAATKHYKQYYNNPNIIGIDGHIINAELLIEDSESILSRKVDSINILFIGRKKYKKGLMTLIQAVKEINATRPDHAIRLDVIGLTSNVVNGLKYDWLTYHGILNKSNTIQKQLYYDCILPAKVIVNTTQHWAGISSIVESMYYYTPVITSKYPDFEAIFGSEIDFGFYCQAEDPVMLKHQLEKLLAMREEDYRRLCLSAHENVKAFTWENCLRSVFKQCKLENLDHSGTSMS